MAIIAKDNSNGSGVLNWWKRVFISLFVTVVDLGTQKKNYQNEIKLQRKVRLIF